MSCLTNMENWNQLKHVRLQLNHRVFRAFAEEEDTEKAAIDYLAWLEKVGRGELQTCPERGEDVIRLDDRTICTAQNLTGFVQTVFPNLAKTTKVLRISHAVEF